MEEELTELERIFEEVLPSLQGHRFYRRIKRYSVKLKKLSKFELNLAITFDIMPNYVSGKMIDYIHEQICEKFDVELSNEIISRIETCLNNICKINLQ